MNVMNVALDSWTLAVVAAATLCLCASAVLWLWEKRLIPLRRFAALRRKPPLEVALVVLIVCAFVQYGATKGNGESRVEDEELRHDGAVSALRSQGDASDLRFTAIGPCTTGVALAIALPDGGVVDDSLDLFCTTNLLSPWTLLGEVAVGSAGPTAEVLVAAADLPGSPTNMPPAAFFCAGTHADADGDGLYDGRERRLYGTNPSRWDTDGDGLSDGAEIVAGTDPLLRDTDDDGYPDDEEVCASTDPLSPNAGAAGSIRFFYDDDDRLAAAYVGSEGGAAATRWSPSGDAAATAERMYH